MEGALANDCQAVIVRPWGAGEPVDTNTPTQAHDNSWGEKEKKKRLILFVGREHVDDDRTEQT